MNGGFGSAFELAYEKARVRDVAARQLEITLALLHDTSFKKDWTSAEVARREAEIRDHHDKSLVETISRLDGIGYCQAPAFTHVGTKE